jgi:hypothetical protein
MSITKINLQLSLGGAGALVFDIKVANLASGRAIVGDFVDPVTSGTLKIVSRVELFNSLSNGFVNISLTHSLILFRL